VRREATSSLACNGTGLPPFPLSSLERPGGEEEGSSPQASALARGLTDGRMEVARASGYRTLTAHADRVVYAAGDPPDVTVADVTSEGGEWRLSGLQGCHVAPYREGSYAVGWDVARVDRAADRLELDVTETACAGVPLAARLQEPEVTYAGDSVTVTLYASRPEGNAYCVRTGPTPYTVDLTEPLGDRQLLDGSTYPAAAR
jgi:hypothetical protein